MITLTYNFLEHPLTVYVFFGLVILVVSFRAMLLLVSILYFAFKNIHRYMLDCFLPVGYVKNKETKIDISKYVSNFDLSELEIK